VKRGVTELITPGVSMNDEVLNSKSNNFLASIYFGKKLMIYMGCVPAKKQITARSSFIDETESDIQIKYDIDTNIFFKPNCSTTTDHTHFPLSEKNINITL
jgi:DNA mismatch repair ATPase MutS